MCFFLLCWKATHLTALRRLKWEKIGYLRLLADDMSALVSRENKFTFVLNLVPEMSLNKITWAERSVHYTHAHSGHSSLVPMCNHFITHTQTHTHRFACHHEVICQFTVINLTCLGFSDDRHISMWLLSHQLYVVQRKH